MLIRNRVMTLVMKPRTRPRSLRLRNAVALQRMKTMMTKRKPHQPRKSVLPPRPRRRSP